MDQARAKPADSLSTDDWVRAARAALVRHGVAGVKVDRLAHELRVTRGSFYWHFTDRQALLDALLTHWREQNTGPFLEVANDPGLPPLRRLERVFRIWIDEQAFDPGFDSAVRDWARSSEVVARAMRAADEARIEVLQKIYVEMGCPNREAWTRARIAYFHQVGYYSLRIAEPQSIRRELFPAYFEVLAGQPLPDADPA